MNKLSEEQLRACEGHTPGPWDLSRIPFELRSRDSAGSVYGPTSIHGGACLIADTSRSPGDTAATANGNLIEIAPQLLSEREQLQKEVERLRKEVKELREELKGGNTDINYDLLNPDNDVH